MPKIELLRLDHAQALLSFEEVNRGDFASHVGDRGDAYFAEFSERLHGLLEEQEQGSGFFHVITEGNQQIVGRINLSGVENRTADLGYRVAEDHSGQGIATWAVGEICTLAGAKYGLRRLTAGTADANLGSHRVLERNGFSLVEKAVWGTVHGTTYRKDL